MMYTLYVAELICDIKQLMDKDILYTHTHTHTLYIYIYMHAYLF